jgi:hypothetical protein
MKRIALGMLASAFALVALVCAACGGAQETRGDGLDTSKMPADVRADYDVFARRCSKCHSLARPLNSGIVEDVYWAEYVARMRRQPASGISHEDELVILRFLHYFSLEQKRLKQNESPAPPATPAPAPTNDGGA